MQFCQTVPNTLRISIEAWPTREQVSPAARGCADPGGGVKSSYGRAYTAGPRFNTESDKIAFTARCLADTPTFERDLCLGSDRDDGFYRHDSSVFDANRKYRAFCAVPQSVVNQRQ